MASRRTLAYVTATLAAIFMFAGVVFLMVAVGLCPLDAELDRLELFEGWGIGGLVALFAAVYSFRATVKRQGPRGPKLPDAEVAELEDAKESE